MAKEKENKKPLTESRKIPKSRSRAFRVNEDAVRDLKLSSLRASDDGPFKKENDDPALRARRAKQRAVKEMLKKKGMK